MPIARIIASFAVLALLSACASRPQISAQVESTQYRSRAHRSYTPPGPSSDPWGPYISEAAGKYDVPERWIREVMRQESGGRQFGRGGDLITSGAGAMGLMQVMPGTYDELRARYSELGDDPYDPHNNILAGTAYIREMYDIYGSPGFLAAYNAGPGRLDDYLTRNRTLPEETRRYVASIGPRLTGEPNRPSPGAQYAMNALPFNIGGGTRYAASQRYTAPRAPITLAPTIQLAQVVPSPEPARGNAIVLQPQPAWTPPADPIQLAQGPARGNFITLRPQPAWSAPVEVAEAPEARPEPARPEPMRYEPPRLAAAVPMAPPAPRPAPAFAQLPEPPRAPAFFEPRTQQQLAASALVPAAPRGFGFISAAHAEPIRPRTATPAAGAWAVQVGAFANEGLAASASAAARDHARDVLAPSRTTITPIRQPRGTLYRARLNGLSRDAASQACERLARTRTTCMVVSPDAAS